MSIHSSHLLRLTHACVTVSLLTLIQPGWAQNKASELARDQSVNIPQSMRNDLATIGRYADAVNQRVGKLVEGDPANKPEAAPALLPARAGNALVDPFRGFPSTT